VSEARATVVRLENVAMRYGDGPDVLRDVSLALESGTFHFLVGPSGAGKTSLLRLLSLSQPAHRGVVSLFGRKTGQLSRGELANVRRRIGVVFQDFRLLDHMTAFDNVALPLRISGADDEQISSFVSEMLTWLGLSDLIEAKPPSLSMGQRQLLAVARAVIIRPALLLADEPTSNIDSRRAQRLMRLFIQLHKLGTTVVLASHNDDLMGRHPFPHIQMAAGRVIAVGSEAMAAAD
jgi:cell division transport system ATP-binding protein